MGVQTGYLSAISLMILLNVAEEDLDDLAWAT